MAKSKPATPMPISERAKQFSPFSPLRGLYDALAEKEKIREPRREVSEDMSEEINKTLLSLSCGDIVTVVYYNEPEMEYLQLTGVVEAADEYKRILQIGKTAVNYGDIFEIVINAEAMR